MTAHEYAAALTANTDRWFADEITRDDHTRRNIELWDAIAADPTLHHNVSAILRGDIADIMGAEA